MPDQSDTDLVTTTIEEITYITTYVKRPKKVFKQSNLKLSPLDGETSQPTEGTTSSDSSGPSGQEASGPSRLSSWQINSKKAFKVEVFSKLLTSSLIS